MNAVDAANPACVDGCDSRGLHKRCKLLRKRRPFDAVRLPLKTSGKCLLHGD